jgi:hypothetical protein
MLWLCCWKHVKYVYFFVHSLLTRMDKYTFEMALKGCIIQHPNCHQQYVDWRPKDFLNLMSHLVLNRLPVGIYLLQAKDPPTVCCMHASPTQYLLHACKLHPLFAACPEVQPTFHSVHSVPTSPTLIHTLVTWKRFSVLLYLQLLFLLLNA